MPLQYRAGPLPDPSDVTLTRKLVAVLGDRRGVPVLIEAYVAALKIDEELARVWTLQGAGDVLTRRV